MQRCVQAYLLNRLDSEGEFFLGEKSQKTLRLKQEARAKLLEDFKQLPRSTDPVSRHWEKWLKGVQPTLSITFDQDTATRITGIEYLNVLHPLVRQAARHLNQPGPVHVHLFVQTDEAPQGDYAFALYRWQKRGVKEDESLVAVATEPSIEEALLAILPNAMDAQNRVFPDTGLFEALDSRHYSLWSAAQANHIAMNRELVEHRVQSLTISHRARCNLLEDKILAATNDKIRLMKQGELTRANMDFEQRLADLRQAAESGDIHAMLVVSGVIAISN